MLKKIHLFHVLKVTFIKKKNKTKTKQTKTQKENKQNNSRYCKIAETCLRHKSNYVI